jgi:hypothetical protein
MSELCDPTMAGVKYPFKKLKKLADTRLNLEENILQMLDKIQCIEHDQDEIIKNLNADAGVVWLYRRKSKDNQK